MLIFALFSSISAPMCEGSEVPKQILALNYHNLTQQMTVLQTVAANQSRIDRDRRHIMRSTSSSTSGDSSSWWNQHPQTRSRPSVNSAYRMQCHSCMSGYLEDQFLYISHLYRRPLAFTEKCDQNNFDWQYLRVKNCTDACVTLRMNDKVGGRRRYGFMRGCLSDILHYNRSAVRVYEHGSSATHRSSSPTSNSYCSLVRLRDLFISSDRYAFDAHDHVELCTCVRPLCNAAAASKTLHNGIILITTVLAAYFAFWMLDLDSRQWLQQSLNCEFTAQKGDQLAIGYEHQLRHSTTNCSVYKPRLRPKVLLLLDNIYSEKDSFLVHQQPRRIIFTDI